MTLRAKLRHLPTTQTAQHRLKLAIQSSGRRLEIRWQAGTFSQPFQPAFNS